LFSQEKKMKLIRLALIPLFLMGSLLTGCATVVNGTNQKVDISTPPTTNAQCDLSNSKGKWHVDSTPATIKVHRAFGQLTAVCSKRGYHTATRTFDSNTKKMVFGNAIAGGLIGAGVDAADGAAYSYPNKLVVPMKKR
jgi:hypothetical protein